MTDYETIQKKRNVVVGLFVTIALVALFWLIFKFGDLPVFASEWRSFKVRVQFAAAPGVEQNTPVRFCGYQIGRVIAVQPPRIIKDLATGRLYHQSIVVLSIEKQYKDIPANVEVKLMTRGLSSSYIELTTRPFDVTEPQREFLNGESILQGSSGVTSDFFPAESQKKLDELVNGLTSLIENANDILGDNANKDNIKVLLANMVDASKSAVKTLDELRKFSITAVDAGEGLSEVVDDLHAILEKINNGDGSAGRFINDGRLYEDLLETSQQLEMLIHDVRGFVSESRKNGMPIKLK